MKAVVLGDSQAQGLLPVLGPVLRRHGYELDPNHSWAQQGAGIGDITEHAVRAGPADLALVFSGGGNDPASLVGDQNAYKEKLVTLVGTLRFSGVQNVVLVGPFRSDDAAVARLHDAARLVQERGIPGSRFVDGYALTVWVPHPAGELTHWSRTGYQSIALELEKALFDSGVVTAIGLVGSLTCLGALGVALMEALYARAEG